MSERFTTPAYETRESSKLGVMDYITKHVVFLFLPVIGFAAGLGLRKLTKLPILEQPNNPANFFLKKEMKRDIAAQANEAKGYVRRNGETWGMALGTMAGAFRLWKANSTQQMEVDQLAANITALKEMESPNTYLARENEELRQQVKFSERHHARSGSHAQQALDAAQDKAVGMER